MKKILISCCLLMSQLFRLADAQPVKVKDNEMCWWYDSPATKYWEGLPIGTGRFAGMILGKVHSDEIYLNDETLWSGGPYNPNNPDGPKLLKQIREFIMRKEYLKADSVCAVFNSIPMRVQHYQPMANLNLRFDGQSDSEVKNYRRKLSIDSALVTITYKLGDTWYKREVFASYPDQVIVMKLSADRPGKISLTGWMSSLQPSALPLFTDGSLAIEGGTRDLDMDTYARRVIPGKIRWKAGVRFSSEGGTVKNTRENNVPAIQITDATTVTLVIAGATNWKSWNDVSGNEKVRFEKYLASAAEKNYQSLLRRHLEDYIPLFSSCLIDLGANKAARLNTTARMELMRKGGTDPLFAAQYFQYGRYLMLAGACENTLAFNNHNIWLNDMEGRWQGRWTLNINIQECYWPVESTNLPGLNESLLLFTENLAAAGSRTAREMYSCRGWVAHHGTDVWFNTAPTDGHANASTWPMGGVWIMQQLYDHYLYNPDKKYLERIYPLLKGAARFCLDFLIIDPETGYLVTCPSTTPENYFTLGGQKLAASKGTSMDNQLIRNLFRNTITACKILGIDKALRGEIESAITKLPPHQVGRYGQIQEWLTDFEEDDPVHRHLSPLFAFYPDDDITVHNNPELSKAVSRVLERKVDKYLGWSGAWKMNLYARLGDPEPAYDILRRMLVDVSIHPREEDSRITPSFEGNQAIQGVTAGIAEMLMQSHSGEISFLPALPQGWSTGSITGMKARGGYLVDISWEHGKLKEGSITPVLTGACRIRSKTAVNIFTGKIKVEANVSGNITEFQALANTRYTVVPAVETSLVSLSSEGRLVCLSDAKGNKVPDFSGVGFRNGESPIPDVPVILEMSPVKGDNTTHIQKALDLASTMPIRENGFRGTILFKSGDYEISDPVRVKASGVVIRGEGDKTIFRATGKKQYTLVNIEGEAGKTNLMDTEKEITDIYIPVGSKKATVQKGHGFKTGDMVHIRRVPNSEWIALLRMDLLHLDEKRNARDWTPEGYNISFERRITGVRGDTLTFDAPFVDIIDRKYCRGYVVKFISGRIQNSGIENIRLISAYDKPDDENHAWVAVNINKAENCWVRKVNSYHFGNTAVNIENEASFVTVDSCTMTDPVSVTTGGRKYSFNINGQRSLVQNCVSRGGRHDFVNGSRVAGPDVFYNCKAIGSFSECGPHHRWSTGILFDNVSTDNTLAAKNREYSGTGHGWAGSQIMLWNCKAKRIISEDPPGDNINWAVGCTGEKVGDEGEDPEGIIVSPGKPVETIPSLFKAQLHDRFTRHRSE